MGIKGRSYSVTELAAAGVKRISVGSALARAALGEFMRAAREMKERGTFTFADAAIPFAEINQLMAPR
jgi:2-methylisocitrate lyase-like PEP mutase family enzyme